MKATFNNFTISSNYKGDKEASFIKGNYNNHLVTVTNNDNKLRCTFEFWASVSNPELSIEYDVLNAFYCFVGDAIAGEMDFSEFCREYGYNEDSRTAERTWKACKRSTAKLQRIYSGDIYDLANALGEQYA